MLRILSVLTLGLMLVLASTASAQFTQDPSDFGVADTITMVCSLYPDVATNQLDVDVELWVYNDANDVVTAGCGFKWDNPNLQMTSAEATATAQAAFNFSIFLLKATSLATTNADQEFIFSGLRISGNGMVADPAGRRHWATWHFTLSDWNVTDSIVFDTSFYNQGANLKFIDVDNNFYAPYWVSELKIYDTAFTPPSELVLSEDTLFFSGMVGDPNPAGQTFDVGTSNQPLNFSLNEGVGWLIPAPVTGITPTTVTVNTNIFGLSAGTYLDSIEVVAPSASNTPQYVYCQLDLAEPPPEIGVSPSAIFFNAVAGESDPPSQQINITNDGGETLMWTVSSTESWLELNPMSGSGDGAVTVTAHITGLPFGDYFDTIVVSDPMAINDPVEVPVQLSIGSDLPIISVPSTINWIVDLNELPTFNRWITVENSGAGLMNFYLTETSDVVTAITTDTLQAPDSAMLTLEPGSVGPLDEIIDTVWVNSNEAINSPVPVEFRLRFSVDPAVMVVSPDTVKLSIYNCQQGVNGILPTKFFTVSNFGGGAMSVQCSYESDYFYMDETSGNALVSFFVHANEVLLPVGLYYDTIHVYTPWAFDNRQDVIVQYEVKPPDQTPEMILSRSSFAVPFQENTGPKDYLAFEVLNRFGGCMPWEVQENIDWLVPDETSGDVPGDVSMVVNADGYDFGEYPFSMSVIAPSAGNSPINVDILLRVWRFHGDWNYDKIVDIGDITEMIKYLFLQGPSPQPTYLVGDCNCDNFIDIGDLTVLITYLFQQGPIPCGNPY